MNKTVQTKTGFFVAFKDEAEQIQAEKVVDTGRNGVFYDQERLKNCIQEKQIKDVYMVLVLYLFLNGGINKFVFDILTTIITELG